MLKLLPQYLSPLKCYKIFSVYVVLKGPGALEHRSEVAV